MSLKKFSTQLEEDVLVELRKYAFEADKSISGVVTEAVAEFLNKKRVRPAFQKSMKKILDENEKLLEKLSK